MILHENNIIKLDYNPATDVLQADYPDLNGYVLREVKQTLTLLVETIRNYDVKKLLLDSSSTTMDVSEAERKEVATQLAKDLTKTRLQKVARVQPRDIGREMIAQQNLRSMEQAGLIPYLVRTFPDRAEALAWLEE